MESDPFFSIQNTASFHNIPSPFPLLSPSHSANFTHLRSHYYNFLQPFIQLRVREAPNEQKSLAKTCTALVSPCLPEAWIWIAAFTITDSLSLRLKKLVYYNQQFLRIDSYDEKVQPIHSNLLPCPLPVTTILPYPTNTIKKTSHTPVTFYYMQPCLWQLLPVSLCLSSSWCLSFEVKLSTTHSFI